MKAFLTTMLFLGLVAGLKAQTTIKASEAKNSF